MHFLGKYWRRYRVLFCVSLFFLSMEAFADLAQPALMAKIIDQGVVHHRVQRIDYYGFWMLAILIVGALAAIIRNNLSVLVSQRFAQDLRNDLYQKIHQFTMSTIDRIGRPTLMNRLTNDVTRLQTFANGMMRMMMKAPLVGIGSLILAVRLSPALSTVLLAIVPIITIWIVLNMKLSYPVYRRVQKALDQVTARLQDFLRGVRVVKLFNQSKAEVRKFGGDNDRLARLSISAATIGNLFGPLITLTVNIGIVTILWLGGLRVDHGTLQVGIVIAFTNYLTQILFAIMMVSNAFNMFIRARASAERVGAVFQMEPSPVKNVSRPFVNEEKGTLVFSHVSFHYPDRMNDWDMQQVNFDIKRGQKIGITGSVASGKTTLLKLILHFYTADSGQIYYDGQPLNTIDVHALRERIAMVAQAPLLFTGTIAENIRWGKADATDQEVIRAAALAEADGFINESPLGYASPVGQAGVNLSGGQKQRICLARALIRRPELLLLDEATSAMDTVTDRKIRHNLQQLDAQMTLVSITQRIAALKEMDQIFVLDKGRIAASGTHAELLQTSVYYQELCARQSE
ncbi:MAG: ABC transporter ATP-binding protein [Sporolactobacillus sp.]